MSRATIEMVSRRPTSLLWARISAETGTSRWVTSRIVSSPFQRPASMSTGSTTSWKNVNESDSRTSIRN